MEQPWPNESLPRKPKGMHWSTFDRLIKELHDIEVQKNAELEMRLSQMSFDRRMREWSSSPDDYPPITVSEIVANALERRARSKSGRPNPVH
jgi:hypothetical protein